MSAAPSSAMPPEMLAEGAPRQKAAPFGGAAGRAQWAGMNTTEDKVPAAPGGPPRIFVLRLVYAAGEVLDPPPTFTPLDGQTTIGRDPGCAVPLPGDRRLSRIHASLHTGPLGRLRLVDERSRNGTQRNGA